MKSLLNPIIIVIIVSCVLFIYLNPLLLSPSGFFLPLTRTQKQEVVDCMNSKQLLILIETLFSPMSDLAACIIKVCDGRTMEENPKPNEFIWSRNITVLQELKYIFTFLWRQTSPVWKLHVPMEKLSGIKNPAAEKRRLALYLLVSVITWQVDS